MEPLSRWFSSRDLDISPIVGGHLTNRLWKDHDLFAIPKRSPAELPGTGKKPWKTFQTFFGCFKKVKMKTMICLFFWSATKYFSHQTQHIGFYLTTIFWDYIISIAQVVARLEHLVELADRVETKRRLEAVVVFLGKNSTRTRHIWQRWLKWTVFFLIISSW